MNIVWSYRKSSIKPLGGLFNFRGTRGGLYWRGGLILKIKFEGAKMIFFPVAFWFISKNEKV